MGSSESKITHPSRMTDNREITNTDITPVECVDKASLEEKLNPTSSKRKNESSQKEEDTQKNPAPSGSQGTIDTRITSSKSPQQPLASTNVPPQQPNTVATTSPPQNPITQQNTSSSNRDAKDVTVDELTEMTREIDKTLTPDPAVSSSDNGSESLSMLSQNEIEALILKQYRSNNDKLGSDLASTSGINQRSITDTDLILEEEYVTPRPVVDRDPADWTVQENRKIDGFDMDKFKAANQKQFALPVSSH